jgi:hypothetical protein
MIAHVTLRQISPREPIACNPADRHLKRGWRWLGLLFFAGMGLRAAAFTDLSVYTDSLQTGWDDWSWSATLDFNNSTPVNSGSKSISVAFTGGWAALSFHHGDIDTGAYTNLSFWINGGSSGGQQ